MSGRSWPAFYAGRCGRCNRFFEKGTMVHFENGRVVVEEDCDSTAPEEAAAMGPNERKAYREKLCLLCFTVHAPGQQECP